MHPLRSLLQVKQAVYELKLPLMMWLIPKNFQKYYNQQFENLKNNNQTIITGFDFYLTMHDLLTINNNSINLHDRIVDKYFFKRIKNAKSLFSKISHNRTCSDARIRKSFCICSARDAN